MLNLKNFAERLQDLIIENEINPPILADAIGVASTTITRYLTAKKCPSVEVVVKIADYFNCSTDYILALNDDSTAYKFRKCPPFGQQLKYLFEKQQKTQYSFKKQKRISQSVLYYWLHDVYMPSIYNIIKLSEFFECTVDYVLGRGN